MYMYIYTHTYMYTYVYILHTCSDICEAEGFCAQRAREWKWEGGREREREKERKKETDIKLQGGNSMKAAHVLPLPALVPRHLNLDQLRVCMYM
jgi:hypothetical protein